MKAPISALLLLLLPGLAFADTDVLKVDADKTAVCTDGKSHYVAIAPDEQVIYRLYYGDGKKLNHVRSDEARGAGGLWFPDPRFFDKSLNDSFRGLDMRVLSRIEYEPEKKTCVLMCGDRKVPLTLLEADKAKAVVAGAKIEGSLRKRVPHALARDDRATYYYVDRGATPETEKSFRLFVGPKGALKLQKMTDVASDSEGEIFATKTGSLRFVLGKQESTWIKGGKSKKLVIIPAEQNLQMIYNDLGVYTGERLGTPCDDL